VNPRLIFLGMMLSLAIELLTRTRLNKKGEPELAFLIAVA
jgi:hypothetical protein